MSVTVAEVTLAGPLFVTAKLYCICAPYCTEACKAVFTIARSAVVGVAHVTAVWTELVLLAGVGSLTGLLTVA